MRKPFEGLMNLNAWSRQGFSSILKSTDEKWVLALFPVRGKALSFWPLTIIYIEGFVCRYLSDVLDFDFADTIQSVWIGSC